LADGSATAHDVGALYPAPPWAWSERAALFRYWVRQPVLSGLLDVLPHHVGRLLPTDQVSALGARLGIRAGRSRPQASERARALFRLLRPAADAAAIEAMLAAHWRHVGRCFCEFAALHRLWREGRVEIEGLDHLEAARAGGRPVIIAGLHVGYWEIIAVGLAMLRIPAVSTYQRQPDRFRMRIADNARSRAWRPGVPLERLLPTRSALFGAQRALSRPGGVMLYYVDEFWQGRVHAPLLGRRLRQEGNIAKAVRLAAMTGAAVVPAHALRLGEAARFRLIFSPAVPIGASGRGRAGAREDHLALDAAIEGILRSCPEQWFMAHVFGPDAA
jgi:KDO2-lipid IV(A) lauroyltransferase